MKKYIFNRIVTGIITILFSFTLTFFIIRLAPGSPISVMTGKDNHNPKQIESLNKEYGFDRPVYVQYVTYIKNALKGNFGYSYISDKPVTKLIGEKVVSTLVLTFSAAVLSLLIGTYLGIIGAKHEGGFIDKFFSIIFYMIDSMPVFWLGILFIVFFAGKLKWFPTSGITNAREDFQGFRKVLDIAHHMFLPLLTLVIIQIPGYFRISRASVLQNINEDYVTLFRASGMSEKKIFREYILSNSITPIVTMFSMSLAFLIAGVTMIEIVFAWPGMGRLIIDSIGRRDYPVLTGIYLLLSILITVVMILTDILYAFLDPRIRLE